MAKFVQCLAGVFDYIPDAPVREFKIPARTWKPSWRRDYKSKDNLVHPDSAPKTAEPTIASIGLVNLENKLSPLARKGYYVKKHQPARSQDSGKRGKWNLFGVHQSKKEITTQRPKTEKKSFWDVFGKKHLPARSQDSGKRGKFNVFGRLQSEKEITTQRPKPEKKSFWDVFGKKSGSSKVQPLVPKYKNVGTQVSKEEFPEISMASRSTMTDPKIKVSMETQVEEKDFENISKIAFPCVKRPRKRSFLPPLERPTRDVFASISFPCVIGQRKRSFLPPLETPTGDVFFSKPLPRISLIIIKEAKLDDKMAEY
ncbi:uncharacterized protein LOC142750934 isoform X3 [Rhinoderma darwinii]|uniref:uncharacterized protein LOC142750934 isoform X3 n=1 Tax=Rhinoderma darwinii TaxID=43563 RepID=UPI003F676C13